MTHLPLGRWLSCESHFKFSGKFLEDFQSGLRICIHIKVTSWIQIRIEVVQICNSRCIAGVVETSGSIPLASLTSASLTLVPSLPLVSPQ
jgi:hypothetical protein